MRNAKENRDLKLAVSLALTAGLFAVPQISYGAPVLDPSSTRNANYVDVKQHDKVTDITGKQAHNVIDWKYFSINQGETVQFDQGAKTRDYLNLVTGDQQSTINGALKGGKDVYIVNPNGVVFGKGASVDVGNLYVSTTKATLDVSKYLASGASPLVNTAYQAAGAVTNLGKIAANRVEVEGGNIKFLNTADVTDSAGAINSNVKITTSIGKIQLGHEEGDTTTYTTLRAQNTAALKFGLRRVRGSNYDAPENYTTITTWSQLSNVKNNLSGNYWLGADLDGGNRAISALSGFSGTFDGNYGTISNFTVTASGDNGGLFGALTGKVCNLGIINETTTAKYAGGIAGQTDGATLEHVYVKNSTINGTYITSSRSTSGGLIGSAKNSTISESYASGNRVVFGGGLVGALQGGNTIKNVYSTGGSVASQAGLYYIQSGSNTITNAYTTFENIALQTPGSGTVLSGVTDSGDYQKAAHYNDWKDDKGNQAVSADGATNTVWRIYEGQTLPLLRDFLKAHGTVTVNYSITGSTVQGNDGKNLSITYNHQQLNPQNITYTGVNTKGNSVDVNTDLIHTGASQDFSSANTAYNDTSSVGKAYFWSDQDGYDLVGNNVAIKQRKVVIDSSLQGKHVTKVYDGSAAIKDDDIKSMFEEQAATSDTGLIQGDDTAKLTLTKGTKAYFVTSETGQEESPDAGADKWAYLDGGMKLDAETNTNGITNYYIDGGEAQFNNVHFGGNTITQAPLTVSLANAINKTYNHSSLVDKTLTSDDFTLDGKKSRTVTVSGTSGTKEQEDSVSLSFDPAANYVDENGNLVADTGKHSIKFTGLKLDGAQAGNYYLVDGTGNTIYQKKTNGVGNDIHADDGGILYGKGEIYKRNILNTGFKWYKDGIVQDAVREYNNSDAYSDPDGNTVRSETTKADGNTGMLQGDDLTFKVTKAHFITSSTDAKAAITKNAGEAKGVAYEVTVSGAAAKNYTLGGDAITAGQTNTVVGEGSITPRTLNIVYGKGADKYYDGDADVKDKEQGGSSSLKFSDDWVKYGSVDEAHQLVHEDGSTISVSGTYDNGADVVWKNGNPAAEGITYHVKVTNADGSDSTNYVFSNQKASADITGATGTIHPARITKVMFADVSKEFNNTATVDGKQATDQIKITGATGLVGSDTADAILSMDNVVGTYGNGTGEAFKENKHANNGAEKDVRYSGIALKNTEGNYVLVNATEYGQGKITPLTITDDSRITLENTKPIEKVYNNSADVATDGTNDKQNATHAAKDYVADHLVYTLDSGETINLQYDRNDVTANYNDKNAGEGKDVTYHLKVSSDADGDYTLDAKKFQDNKLDKTLSGAGKITPRVVTASLVHDNIDKIYDATTDVVDEHGSLLNGDNIVKLDGLMADGVSNGSTAEYRSADVNLVQEKPANVGITYAVKLNGSDSSVKNYKLTSQTLEGEGTIQQREIDVAFKNVDSVGHAITKVYDGDTTVDQTASYVFSNLAPNGTDGTSNQSVNSARLKLSFSKAYENADVNQTNADGSSSNWVNYTDLSLGGSAKDNYKLHRTSAKGDGSITANKLTLATLDPIWNTLSKTYDASNDVAYNHSDSTKYFKDETKGIDETGSKQAYDFVKSLSLGGVDFGDVTGNENKKYSVLNGVYQSADAGTVKTAEFTFQLKDNVWRNFDFTDSDVAKLYDAKNHTLTLTRNDGTITPKYLRAAFKDGDGVTKVYNGLKNLVSNSQENPDGTPIDISDKIAYTGIVDGKKASDVGTFSGLYQSEKVKDNQNGNGVVNYTAELTDKNYQLLDGTNQTEQHFIGAGTITPKTVKIKLRDGESLVKTYDAKSDVASADLSKFVWDGLVNGETNTAATGNNGLVANYVSTNGEGDADVAWDDTTNAATWKKVHVANAIKAFENGAGTASIDNYDVQDTLDIDASEQRSKINRLALDANNIQPTWTSGYSKVYDGTSEIYNPSDVLKLKIVAPGIDNLDVRYDGSAHFTRGINDETEQINHGDNLGIVATITGIKAEEHHNFDFTNLTKDKFHGTYHNYDSSHYGLGKADAKILQRHLSAQIVNPNTKKIYDGTTEVLTGYNDEGSSVTKQSDPTKLVRFVLTDNPSEEGLIDNLGDDGKHGKDGVTNISTAAYKDKNAGTPGIRYSLKLNGDTAGNYVIDNTVSDNGTTIANTIDGEGTIEKKRIHWVVNGNFDKTYDGTANVLADQLAKNLAIDTRDLVTVNGVREAFTLDSSKLRGIYTDSDGKEQSDVNWKNGTIKDWNIRITGADEALANAKGTAIGSNYTLSDTDYFSQASIKGKIKPLSLTMANLKENWSQAKKEYDGTSAVSNPEKYLSLSMQNLKSNEISVGADGVTVSYALKKDGANFAQKDAGKGLMVSYDVAGFDGVKNADGTDNHNFSLAGIANTETTYQNTDGGRAADGLITPRVIAVKTVDGADWNKVYDGSAAVKDAKNKFVFTHVGGAQDSGLDDVLESDIEKGSVKSATVSAYYTEDGSDDKNAGTAKKIRYTASIDDGDKNNYTFVSVDDPADAIQTKSVSAEDSGLTGDITKRTVYVDLDNPDGELVTKTYDGTADVTETNGGLSKWQSRVKAQGYDEAAQTGLVAGDDAALETDAVKVNFGNADVARDNGRVTTKDVYFSNFQLGGKDSGNYELAIAPGKGTEDGKFQTAGMITPKAVQVSIKTTPTKEYDGTTALDPSQASEGNIQVDKSGVLVGNDTLNFSLQSGKAPSYDNAHSNQTNGGKGIGVNYYLTWDNGNYELVHTASGSGDTQTVTTDGMNGTLRTESGIITPRMLTIDSVADVTKVYDGTPDVDNTVVSQTRDANGVYHDGDELNHSTAKITVGRVVNGDDVGFTAVGQYDNPYASSPDGQDDYKHDVTYKFAITNMDYQLKNSTGSGKGYITRRGLTVQAVPADIYAGQDMPTFTGSVTGWLKGETDGSGDFVFHAYTDTTDADGNTKTSRLESARMPGKYAVYGTYNGSFSGNYGRNYHFEQAPANATAFEVKYIPDKPYRETINPSHHPESGGGVSVPKSQNVVTDFVKPAQANIAYPTSNGKATAVDLSNGSDTSTSSAYRAYTQQRGTTIGTMEILNADVVNLDSSRRVDLGDSTAVMQQAAGSRVGRIEIKSADNGATLTITNDFPEAFEAEHQVSEKKAQAAVEHASA